MPGPRDDLPLVTPDARRRGNVRLAWALAAFVAVVFVGFLVKSAIFGI